MSLWTFFQRNNCDPQNAGALTHKMQVILNVYFQHLRAEEKCKLGVVTFITVSWLAPYLVLQT